MSTVWSPAVMSTLAFPSVSAPGRPGSALLHCNWSRNKRCLQWRALGRHEGSGLHWRGQWMTRTWGTGVQTDGPSLHLISLWVIFSFFSSLCQMLRWTLRSQHFTSASHRHILTSVSGQWLQKQCEGKCCVLLFRFKPGLLVMLRLHIKYLKGLYKLCN